MSHLAVISLINNDYMSDYMYGQTYSIPEFRFLGAWKILNLMDIISVFQVCGNFQLETLFMLNVANALVSQSEKCKYASFLKLLSHIFAVIFTRICIIFTVSDYSFKFKDCNFPEFCVTDYVIYCTFKIS